MAITIRDLTEWAAANNVPDTAELVTADGVQVMDLATEDDGDGAMLVLEFGDE